MPATEPPPEDAASALHTPVLLERALELLGPALAHPDAVAVDATLGMGGHTEAMLAAHPALTVIGVDRDPQALELAGARLAGFGDRFRAYGGTYDRIPEALRGHGRRVADAILFDLGVSSLQLDRDERGFSYARDSVLDMRMDQTQGQTAADILNTYPVGDLARMLRRNGDERFATQIARAVVREREREPFISSARFVELIRSSIPAAARRTGGNPAKRSFQALRIEVNAELAVLTAAIPSALGVLSAGGRMVVMSYHSGEDRIVKAALRAATDPPLPPGLPMIPEQLRPTARVLTRGSQTASEDEVRRNPRAASVRLRAVEKLGAGSREAT